MKRIALYILILASLMTACSSKSPAALAPTTLAASASPTLTAPSSTQTPAIILSPSPEPPLAATATPAPSPTPAPTFDPASWPALPIVPQLDERLKAIYQHGQELGNDPHAFSKIGDCGSTPAWFLGDFDRGEQYYSLGEYQNLEESSKTFRARMHAPAWQPNQASMPHRSLPRSGRTAPNASRTNPRWRVNIASISPPLHSSCSAPTMSGTRTPSSPKCARLSNFPSTRA